MNMIMPGGDLDNTFIWNLTCHTVNCINEGIIIPLPTDALLFYCGGCGQEIKDAVKQS